METVLIYSNSPEKIRPLVFMLHSLFPECEIRIVPPPKHDSKTSPPATYKTQPSLKETKNGGHSDCG
jgi:hypothetical protein